MDAQSSHQKGNQKGVVDFINKVDMSVLTDVMRTKLSKQCLHTEFC